MDIEHFIEFIYEGKIRKTGEKATSHFDAVRDILIEAGIADKIVLDAALLHDVLEDTRISKNYLALHFGEKVADIVDSLSKHQYWHTPYCKLKNHIDTIEASSLYSYSQEVLLIKMADRLHNLQTLHGFSPAKQQEYIQETYEYLLPLFERLNHKDHFNFWRTATDHLLAQIYAVLNKRFLSSNALVCQ